jgi:tRNA-modifying protein YgfZ
MTMTSTTTLFADRSDRAKLRVTGPQRLWFLHQILTQAFEDLAVGEARDAAMITAHGRMLGYLEALGTEDAVLCHFEPELRESLAEAISSYVFATQVELQDVTDDMGLILVASAEWRNAAAAIADGFEHPTSSLGSPAGYVWVAAGARAEAVAALQNTGAREATEAELEAVRIANGVPRWGREMDNKTFPQEAGIDERAVRYHKGCYLGQEAMAKIHFRGKVNRRLAKLESDAPLASGADVVLDEKKIGRVTSAADSLGLALVKYTVEPGTRVVAGGAPATIVG